MNSVALHGYKFNIKYALLDRLGQCMNTVRVGHLTLVLKLPGTYIQGTHNCFVLSMSYN